MKTEPVKHINLVVTYHCNSRCTHCNIWQRRPEGELTRAEIKRKILDDPLLAGIESVGITGGEPFLRKDLEDICLDFSQAFPQIHIGIASNGMMGLKIAERSLALRDALPNGQFSLSISIDGEERDHDLMRGISGAFQKTMHTVRKLKAESIPICLSFTITKQNYQSLLKVYELACSEGIGFITRLAQNSSYYGNQETDFSWDEDSLREASSALDQVIGKILANYDLRQSRLDPYIYFLTRSVEYTQQQRRLTPCFSGSHSLFIDSFGNVFPCIMLARQLGSLRESSLSDIFHSRKADEARCSIARQECHCWTECETIRSLEAMPEVLRWDPKQTLPQYGLEVRDINGVLHAVRG